MQTGYKSRVHSQTVAEPTCYIRRTGCRTSCAPGPGLSEDCGAEVWASALIWVRRVNTVKHRNPMIKISNWITGQSEEVEQKSHTRNYGVIS